MDVSNKYLKYDQISLVSWAEIKQTKKKDLATGLKVTSHNEFRHSDSSLLFAVPTLHLLLLLVLRPIGCYTELPVCAAEKQKGHTSGVCFPWMTNHEGLHGSDHNLSSVLYFCGQALSDCNLITKNFLEHNVKGALCLFFSWWHKYISNASYTIFSPHTLMYLSVTSIPVSLCQSTFSPSRLFLSSVLVLCHCCTSWEGVPHIKAFHHHPSEGSQQIWDNWVLLEVPLKPTVPLWQEKSINKRQKEWQAGSLKQRKGNESQE